MDFDSLTPHEKMLKTVEDLEKREEKKKVGERAANDHIAETCTRISKRLACERRRRGYRW